MGIFSSKKKYFGSGVAIPLFDEDPNAGRNLMSEAVFKAVTGGTDIVEAILGVARLKPQIDTEGFYEYGKTTYGLPRMFIAPEPFSRGYDESLYKGLEITEKFEPYPIIALRVNNTSLVRSQSNTTYVRGKRALEYLSVDIDGTMDALAENPDISSINDAAIGMNIPLLAESQEAKSFMFSFFEKLMDYSWYHSTSGSPSRTNYLNYLSGEFKVSLAYRWISKTSVSKSGEVGDMTATPVVRPKAKVTTYEEQYQGPDLPSITVPVVSYYDDSSFIITKQVTGSLQEQIEVRGIQHRTYVHRKGRLEPVTLQDLRDDPDVKENFYIPLDFGIMEELFGKEETASLARLGVTLNVNALEVQKVKWYQTGIFKFILFVVGVVISAFTLGAGAALFTFVVGAISLSGVLSPELQLILGLVLAVYTLGSSVASTITQGIQLTAESLLKYSISTLSMVLDVTARGIDLYVYQEMEDLLEESNEYQSEMDAVQAEIDAASSLLREDTLPFNHIGVPCFNPNETPTDFYSRAIHNNNKGPYIFNTVSNFVDLSIQLPEFDGELENNPNYSLNF